MGALRLFIAIDLPADVREALCTLVPTAPGVRPIKADNIHLTLHFIGQAEPAPVIEALGPAAAACAPFDMRLCGVGFFHGRHRSSVLWAGVERVPDLVRLHTALGRALAGLGIAVDTRPFQPHITVARGERVDRTQLDEFVDYHADFAAAVRVDSFVLYSSELTKVGPLYRIECRYPLTGPDQI